MHVKIIEGLLYTHICQKPSHRCTLRFVYLIIK